MKHDNVNYFTVGLFVLGMLAVLIVVLYRLTGHSADTTAYYVKYDNITGVDVGTAVTFGGFKVGQVQKIGWVRENGHTRFRLTLGIRNDWKLPADSVALIVSPGMLSDNQIDIREGKSSKYLAAGAEMKGKEQVSIMSVLNDMAYQLEDVSNNSVKPLLDNLNRQISTVGGDLAKQLPHITADASRLLVQLNAAAGGLQRMLGPKNRTHMNNVMANADELTRNLVALSRDFGRMSAQLDTLLKHSNQVVSENRGDIRDSIVSLRSSLDAVSRNINTIVYNLDSTSRNMNEFSRQIRDNPGRLLGGSAPRDKGASLQ